MRGRRREHETQNKQKLHSVSACLQFPLSTFPLSLVSLLPLLLFSFSPSWSSTLTLLHAQINSRLQLLLLLSALQALEGKEELKGEGAALQGISNDSAIKRIAHTLPQGISICKTCGQTQKESPNPKSCRNSRRSCLHETH